MAGQAERDLNSADVWSSIAMINVFLSTEELTVDSDWPTKKPSQGMRIVCVAGPKTRSRHAKHVISNDVSTYFLIAEFLAFSERKKSPVTN